MALYSNTKTNFAIIVIARRCIPRLSIILYQAYLSHRALTKLRKKLRRYPTMW